MDCHIVGTHNVPRPTSVLGVVSILEFAHFSAIWFTQGIHREAYRAWMHGQYCQEHAKSKKEFSIKWNERAWVWGGCGELWMSR